MSDTTPQVKYRKDYAETDFCIDKVDLDFHLDDEFVLVRSELQFSRRKGSVATELQLDGEGLELKEIYINGSV